MFDIQALRDELREHLGVDEDDLPNASADLLINRSYSWLLNMFKFRSKEVSATFPTVNGTRNYDLPDDVEAVRGVSIEDPNSMAHTPLDRMTTDDYESNYTDSTDLESTPTNYVREGSCIRLWPTPDTVYEITLKYDRLLSDLSDSNTAPDVPPNWEEMILLGAVFRGYLRLGDNLRARELKQHVESLAVQAKPQEKKEEFDSHRAGLDVILPSYDV
jgi:hypothetical protein